MVFEHLFPDSLLERKEWSAFFLAIIYSVISIFLARLLFPSNSGIVSVVFLSIFLIPYFETILKREEKQEMKDRKRTFFKLLKDNYDIVKTYYFLFMGVYLTYMLFAFFAPYFGVNVGLMFKEQLSLGGFSGAVTFNTATFSSILFNNWWVLLACFLIALIAGDGAIFFVAWNASTWGAIFGYRAIVSSTNSGESAIIALLIIVVITLPHLLLEAGAYILAAISGGVISDEINHPSEVRKFVLYIFISGLLFLLVYKLLGIMFVSHPYLLELLAMLLIIGLLYLMRFVLEDRGDIEVFTFNLHLFVFAVGIFVLGAIIETLVLYNATPLRHIYSMLGN